jgi:hypothetical protein
MFAPVLVPLIMLVPAPVLVAGIVPVFARPVIVPFIMLVHAPVLVAGIVPVPVPVTMPILVALIMARLMPGIMAIFVRLILLTLVPWPCFVQGRGDPLPAGLPAAAVEAPRAITPAATTPTFKGRTKAVNFCPSAPMVPISLLCRGVMMSSILICPFLWGTSRVLHACSGSGQEP